MKLPNDKRLFTICTAAIVAVLLFCSRKGENTATENGITTSHTPQENVKVAKQVDAPKQDKDRGVTRSHEKKEIDLGEYEQLVSDLHTRIQYDEFNGHEIKVSTLEDDSRKMTLFEIKGKEKIGITYDKDSEKYTIDIFSKNGRETIDTSLRGPIGVFGAFLAFDPVTGNVTISLGEGQNTYDVTYDKIAAPGVDAGWTTKSTTVRTATTVERTTPSGTTFTGTEFSDKVTTYYDTEGSVSGSRIEGDVKGAPEEYTGISFTEERDRYGNMIKRIETGPLDDDNCFPPQIQTREIWPDGTVTTKYEREFTNPETGVRDKKRTTILENGILQEEVFEKSVPGEECDTGFYAKMEPFRHDQYIYDADGDFIVNSLVKHDNGFYTQTYGLPREDDDLEPLRPPTLFTPVSEWLLQATEKDANGNIFEQYLIPKNLLDGRLEKSNSVKESEDNSPQAMMKHSDNVIFTANTGKKDSYQR